MRRSLPLAAAAFLALTAYAYQMAAPSGRVLACYCTQSTDPLAETATTDPVTIVAGTVGVAQPDRTLIVVDSWFHGPFPSDKVWVRGGSNSSSSCDLLIDPGERRVLVLWGGPRAPGANGLYSTDMCQRDGLIGTPAGDALLAEAIAAFPPVADPSTGDRDPAPLDLTRWLGSAMPWIIALAAAGAVLLGAVVLVARRRPSK